jgi:transposase
MTDDIPRRFERVEVLTGVQRRRRWTPEEKIRMVEETYMPGSSVSFVARQHGVGANQLFTWRRPMSQGALTAATAGEEVVPASDYRAREAQVAELQRMLGKKTMENEILREAVSRAAGPKTYGPPRPQECLSDRQLTGLHQRIRHSGKAVAKMEIRTLQAS